MTYCKTLVAVLLLCCNTAYAYTSGSSSSHCEKPQFSSFDPAQNKYTQSFREFSLTASSNTTPASLVVHVSIGDIKYEFTAKDLQITQLRSGQYDVRGKINKPVENGFARISVTAHSKPGCEHTQGVLVRIY